MTFNAYLDITNHWDWKKDFILKNIFEKKLEDKVTTIGIGWTCMEEMIIVKENGEIQLRTM
jgi:hypothetical protein